MIKIIQIGLGPLGIKTFNYIQEKKSMQTVAAVDIDQNLLNKDLGELAGMGANGLHIKNALDEVENLEEVDVAVLTTSSSLKNIAPQIEAIVNKGIPVVSSCEELTFPWKNDAALADKLNDLAKSKGVAVVSTGVNPGFLMDTLPSMLTSVCRDVEYIQVNRFQDAQTRRIPFQKKIGAGLSLEEFDQKVDSGTLRHVGLKESMEFIANSVGWEIDYTEDIISPIIAEEDISTPAMNIPKGNAQGVRQVGSASFQGVEKIKLTFEAAVGTGISYDEVNIKGTPDINSRIEGGVHGDIATCSIILNTIPNLLKSSAGLKTMKDIPLVSFCP